MGRPWDDREAAALPDDLERMAYLSRLLGADPLLVQPGGGNTSLKWTEKDPSGRDIAVLRVKASGFDLAALDRRGFAALRMDRLRPLRERESMTDEEILALLEEARLEPGGPPPSIETPLHALLPFRCIAHVHDRATLGLTDTSRREAPAREALGGEAAVVGYVRPGFPLARTVRDLGDLGAARGLVLGKHGLVAWGGTPRECHDNLRRLVSRAEEFIARSAAARPAPERRRHPDPGADVRRARAAELLPFLRGALSREERILLRWDGSEEAAAFAASQRAKDLHRRGMATPDHIYQCGRTPLYVDAPLGTLAGDEARGAILRALDRFESEYRASFARHGRGQAMHPPRPRVLILPGVGLAASGKGPREAGAALECYRHVIRVMEAAEAVDQFRFLEEASSFEIEYWPWERVRPPRPEGPLARRSVLVDPDPAGLGEALGPALAAAGACVARAPLGDPAAGPRAVEEAVLNAGGVDAAFAGTDPAPAGLEALARAMQAQGGGILLLTGRSASPGLARRARDLADAASARSVRLAALAGEGPGLAKAAVELVSGARPLAAGEVLELR